MLSCQTNTRDTQETLTSQLFGLENAVPLFWIRIGMLHEEMSSLAPFPQYLPLDIPEHWSVQVSSTTGQSAMDEAGLNLGFVSLS